MQRFVFRHACSTSIGLSWGERTFGKKTNRDGSRRTSREAGRRTARWANALVRLARGRGANYARGRMCWFTQPGRNRWDGCCSRLQRPDCQSSHRMLAGTREILPLGQRWRDPWFRSATRRHCADGDRPRVDRRRVETVDGGSNSTPRRGSFRRADKLRPNSSNTIVRCMRDS